MSVASAKKEVPAVLGMWRNLCRDSARKSSKQALGVHTNDLQTFRSAGHGAQFGEAPRSGQSDCCSHAQNFPELRSQRGRPPSCSKGLSHQKTCDIVISCAAQCQLWKCVEPEPAGSYKNMT